MTSAPLAVRSRGHALAGAFGGALAFVVLYAVAISKGTGGIDYPLDDVYIHLAMADQIAAGGYGVNDGEYASAASSPLYPVLLAPFSGTELQRLLPLIWNALALVAASAMVGAAIARAGAGWLGKVIAFVAPVSLGAVTTAYTGMENMLHGAVSLMVVWGLWRVALGEGIGWVLVAGVLLAPALRLEGLALALAASGGVFLLGSRLAGFGLAMLALLPVLFFSGFLLSLGLEPLPNSVIAKLADAPGGDGSLLSRVWTRFSVNVAVLPGGRLLAAIALMLVLAALRARRIDRRLVIFASAIALALAAHLALGTIGWMDRYENYAVISGFAALALMLPAFDPPWRIVIPSVIVALGALTYVPRLAVGYSGNVRAMQLQQKEMARFAKQFAQVNVAVNDLGHVAWRNPNHVLDLFGLASETALKARLADDGNAWVPPLIAEKDVHLVMIYDTWLGELVQPDWERLGELRLRGPAAFIGGLEVAFYATPRADADALRTQLAEWAVDLPEGASFAVAAR